MYQQKLKNMNIELKLKPEVRLKKVKSRIDEIVFLLKTDSNNLKLKNELVSLMFIKDDIKKEMSRKTSFVKYNSTKPRVDKIERIENLKKHLTELNSKIGKKNKETFIAKEKMLFWQKLASKHLSKKELEAAYKEINDLETLLNK